MFRIVCVVFLTVNLLYAEKIELKDGSVIYGDFEGVMDDYYVIRTKYGILSVAKSELLTPPDIQIATGVINGNKGYELKIIIKKSSDVYTRFFYENDVITSTQVLSLTGVIISSSGFVKDGIYYEYDESGNLMAERTIKNSLDNGPVIEFYPDGIVKSRIDFKDGKINGKAFFYTPDSKLILEQTYSNNVLDGFSIEYDLDGNVKSRVLYSQGKIADSIAKKDDSEKQPDEQLENKIIENPKNISTDRISTKVIKIARGKKIFLYKNNKYTGSFSIDGDYNVIDINGKISNGEIIVEDGKTNLIFNFSNNWPISLKIVMGGVIKDDFIYDENGRAKRK
ncbi:MAG: hypothetical protein K6357_05935 [Elusimicrobiota bacterium]